MKHTGQVDDAVLVDVGHASMFVSLRDEIITPALLRDRLWEPLSTQLVTHEVAPGHVVLDIGANAGYFTLLCSTLVGSAGRVIAVEPDPANLALLSKNVELNARHNITIVPLAASSGPRQAALYLTPTNVGGHSLYGDAAGASVPVECVALDEYFDAHPGLLGPAGAVDFIKIDIEGGEGHALRGMTRLLRNNPGVKVLMEFWPGGLRRSGVDPRDCLALFDQHGFTLYIVDDRYGVRAFDRDEVLRAREGDETFFWMLYAVRGEWRPTYELPTTFGRIERAIDAIAQVVPPGDTFILVDQDKWSAPSVIRDRRRLHFLERDGLYWGLPEDDRAALEELERLRNGGATFLAMAWQSFWWLDFYKGFEAQLSSNGGRVYQDDNVVVFDLRARSHSV